MSPATEARIVEIRRAHEAWGADRIGYQLEQDGIVPVPGRHGVPDQILTDNGKVFTGRFGPAGSSAEVLFDRICAENGIRHLLTAPRSPTTTGKVERWHKTIRAEFLAEHDYKHATMAELQQALDAWVGYYNTGRPHQALGMRPPVERFQIAAPKLDPAVEAVLEPALVPAGQPVVESSGPIVRLPGLQRWVDQHGLISLAGFRYRVPIVLAGEQVEAVAAEHLVRIFHRDVLVAEHVQRRKPDTGQRQEVRLRQVSRRSRRATDGMVVTRVVDSSGYVSFAGTNYRVGNSWRGRSAQVCIVAGSMQLSYDGHIVRVHPIRHDRSKEHGAFRHPERAAPPPPGCAGRCQRQGQAAARSSCRPSLDPDPLTRRHRPRRGTTQPEEQC